MVDSFEKRVAEIRERMSAYYGGDPDPLQDNAADDIAFLLHLTGTAQRDGALLDFLEATLTPDAPTTEVFLAGLRSGANPASAFQCEIAPSTGHWHSHHGETLRDAIRAAMSAHPPQSAVDDGSHTGGQP